MAAFLLHISASDILAEREAVPDPFARAFANAPGHRRLGSVFVDLPYFEALPLQIIRYFVGRVSLDHPWGQILHSRGSGRFALGLVEAIRRSHARSDGPISFLGGYLSHHAVDRVIHPIVQDHVREALGEDGGRAGHHHSVTERFQSLFFHEELLGSCIAGTPYPRDLTRSFPGSSLLRARLPEPTASIVQSALLTVHARAPSRGAINSWIRWASWYGFLMSSRHGAREGLGTLKDRQEARRRFYEQPRIRDEVDRANALTRTYLEAAASVLEAPQLDEERRARFMDTVPDVCLDMGH